MTQEEALNALRKSPQNVRFSVLSQVCDACFGEPRQKGASHRVYRTPWRGDPRVNIQNDRGKAKAYQVRQVIKAIEKLEEQGGQPLRLPANDWMVSSVPQPKPQGGMNMVDHYTYRITWSAEDREHLGLCAEFPSLSWLAPTPAQALAGIQKLVGQVVEDMRANGEPVPAPLADRAYSGKFMVRVPPQTHRALAIKAAEERVSLNRLVSARLG